MLKSEKPTLEEINTVKKRFMALNRERLQRTQSALRERQRDFLEVLPLLFHINHPSLPGFISKSTPAGVAEYRPSDFTIKTIKKFSKSFDQKRRALLRFDIYSLFLMGSGGTVAYSKKSDFDIWVCHTKELDGDQLKQLRQKGLAIEEWAMSFDLEVHFFLVEAETFGKGVHEDISAESSGSAQHYLLMEEFYRTGLLLCGRYPLWWIIPPDQENNYEAYAASLRAKRFITKNEYIDLGALPGVPAEEFFGAALWQLYKSIDSPYKSVLKLLLMESYAAEYPDIKLLCHLFKQAIYDGEINLDELDPYIMMYKKLEDYLEQREESERLSLLRRCFYFKVNEPLSVPDKRREESWRRDLMKSVTQSWAWREDYLAMLDSRSEWKIGRVVKERAALVKALTFSYRFLSDFARKHAQLASINQKDLNILGRKLYAAFERKAGKVEIVNRGISSNLRESHLSFYRSVGQDGKESWLLFTAPLKENETIKERPLRRSHSLIELLSWCHFNAMMNNNTVLAMQSNESDFTSRELKELLFSFQRLFPEKNVIKTEISDFMTGALALHVGIFVNLGIDPMKEYARNGHHLMSDHNDALSYGGLGENLALSFDMITITTWKEVLTSRYTGASGLLECLREYVRWTPISKGVTPPELSAQCYSSGRAITIKKRIEELFRDVVACFYQSEQGGDSRYILSVENKFYITDIENNILNYEVAHSYPELVAQLGEHYDRYRPVVIDRQALQKTLLPSLFSFNRPGVVQLFYQISGVLTEIYVLDERGSLFFQKMSFVDGRSVLSHFSLFFDSILNRQRYEIIGFEEENMSEVKDIEYFEIISRAGSPDPSIARRELHQNSRPTRVFNIQVIGAVVDHIPVFRIYCNEMEFSSAEYGPALFKKVAQHVLSLRKNREPYPIYITDMDMPHAMLSHGGVDEHVQTIYFLNYKRKIERQLNDALAEQVQV
ncbi:MAG: class I adenylate cyclase [Gammaproteobacteria bacterium]|nr:class I adenylate cyclase [Gammaproteobacteria bacterium]